MRSEMLKTGADGAMPSHGGGGCSKWIVGFARGGDSNSERLRRSMTALLIPSRISPTSQYRTTPTLTLSHHTPDLRSTIGLRG